MTELGFEARALLAAAREGLGPDEAAIARLHARIAAAVVAPPPPPAPPAAANGVAVGKVAAAKLAAAKLAALVVAGSVAAGAVVVGVQARRVQPRAPAVPELAVPELAPHDRDMRPPPVVQHEEAAIASSPAPRSMPLSPPAHAVQAAEAEPPAPGPSSPTLAREVELLDAATDALHAARYADAIAAIESYTRETAGHGQLAEEAATIAVEASCRLGTPDATAQLDEFDRRWPHSGERARLGAACGKH